ncbi:hypothetical protein D5R81_02570 [Parashewanella spongiae]|uniref:Uncharacterized protein n=1 Tax=Parashewanella spongiae TaxID=342950 RepID=A0A3A6UIZ7_9GAMM|nr:hypothetical protein [Parashewanella spongiae]MCL1080321.1 hypothetical protein [Parashewanella spongiae]RJY19062.1 hypothetical protein D5R81_02570 [Parashewanella spongiae]
MGKKPSSTQALECQEDISALSKTELLQLFGEDSTALGIEADELDNTFEGDESTQRVINFERVATVHEEFDFLETSWP